MGAYNCYNFDHIMRRSRKFHQGGEGGGGGPDNVFLFTSRFDPFTSRGGPDPCADPGSFARGGPNLKKFFR